MDEQPPGAPRSLAPATQFDLASLELDVVRLATAVRYLLIALDTEDGGRPDKQLMQAASREVGMSLDMILARWKYRRDPEALERDLSDHFRNAQG